LQRSIALIEADPALAARTLRLANSAFYGVPGRVGSIGDAVRILGLRTVSGVLFAVAMHGAFRVGLCPGFHFRGYWQHALATALGSRAMAPLASCDPDLAFLAGLMHDIGQLALAAFVPVQASQALTHAREFDLSAERAELAVLGMGHPRIGALIARHWGFPSSLVQAIERHHEPLPAGAEQRLSLSGLVHAADSIACALDPQCDPDAAVPAPAPEVWRHWSVPPVDMLRVLAVVEHGTREMCEILDGTRPT
jgi:putative nucleotidyltransferase with HDIG domain